MHDGSMGRGRNRQQVDREFQPVGERARGIPKPPGCVAEERGGGTGRKGRGGRVRRKSTVSTASGKEKEGGKREGSLGREAGWLGQQLQPHEPARPA